MQDSKGVAEFCKTERKPMHTRTDQLRFIIFRVSGRVQSSTQIRPEIGFYANLIGAVEEEKGLC